MNTSNIINLHGTVQIDAQSSHNGPAKTSPVLVNKNAISIVISEFIMIYESEPQLTGDYDEFSLEIIDDHDKPQRLVFDYPLGFMQSPLNCQYFRVSLPSPLGIVVPPSHFARIRQYRTFNMLKRSLRYHLIGYFGS